MRLPKFLNRRRFRARRPFQLTAAGWVFILYTVGVGAGAINTGNNLLYLIFGVFLGLIMASGALSDMSLWGLSAECFWPRSTVAGATAMIPVRVRNEKRFLPSICITVEIQAELRGRLIVGRAYIPYIASGASVTAHVVFSPEERGWLQLRALRFQTRYPFGLLKKQWTAVENDAFDGTPVRSAGLFIFPAPLATAAGARPPASSGANPVASDGRRGEGDNMYGLREFRETDNPRRIHWKASAKRSAGAGPLLRPWLVRETERDQDSEIVLSWDATFLSALRHAERETAIRYGAGLIEAYAAEGHRIRLAVRLPDGRMQLVGSDEPDGFATWEFLSLWTPEAADDAGAARYLSPPRPEGPERSIDVITAYRGWRGTAA